MTQVGRPLGQTAKRSLAQEVALLAAIRVRAGCDHAELREAFGWSQSELIRVYDRCRRKYNLPIWGVNTHARFGFSVPDWPDALRELL